MKNTKTLVASFSTLFRRTHLSTSRCNPLATIQSQTHQLRRESLQHHSSSSAEALAGRLGFPGRFFSSESGAGNTSSGCWNCGEKAAFLFCNSCRSIQPVDDSVDYFQIFGLERKYEISPGSLEGKYKDWQKKLHPDLVHNKSQKERDYAADQSAKMKLSGVNVNEEETITDPTLLMES
ncbi:PREDICTED: iron-sulfur cluster co-chaperone protein HscB, mitochondrial-like [Camelina sativa]|uniref:Iron-sulfur cluster co-chaperone protein HscB, mitochondrial-like n=1 Tax=Camelina sativa TaxID=90675 RepID=A0ABM1RE61_CAMSA|nr:PREDICTED: iron-sulfur cluster co-chaperone protein HscB, mitochondrial-like [Camelina sativa]